MSSGRTRSPEATEEKPHGQPAASTGMVQFDASGGVVDLGRRAIMQAGFSEKRFVQLSPKAVTARSASGRDQWQLTKINNDGCVLLVGFQKDGHLLPGSV